jgi:PPOX class probable F420-dependent enzyme
MAELSEKVVEFLSAGTRTGMLGYVAGDGRPLVAPVWFVVDDGQLVFNTGRDTSKGHALMRDSRVAICVDDPHPPYSFVQVQGCKERSHGDRGSAGGARLRHPDRCRRRARLTDPG